MVGCKKKAAAPPAAMPAAKRGGAGRGAGSKATGVNAPGRDDPMGPMRKQTSLGDLLGERLAKRPRGFDELIDQRKPGGSVDVIVAWDYVRHIDGDKDEVVPQQQRRLAKVKYDFANDKDDKFL